MIPRRPVRAPEPAAELDEAADAVHRLAILLAAGLEPLAALRLLDPAPAPILRAAACEGPLEVPAALAAEAEASVAVTRAWGYLAACWTVATEVGAPLAATLERAADTLRALADADRQTELALAGPLATARIVALLPLAGVGLSLLIGADPVGVVLGTVPGAISAVLGTLALLLGMRWNARLVAAARVSDPLAGIGHELLALAMAGGAAPDAALARVVSATERCGVAVGVEPARQTLAFAVRAGVPVAGLLRAEAGRARRIALAEALRRAALLGTRLLGPLALCFLPGFVLLGVVPLVIGILRGTLASF
ncbi:MAG: pilus assembly protein TadB [Leifsonia xyli]|nr:MAG: pilus assembly protein TadB [Leifsonia xyli]